MSAKSPRFILDAQDKSWTPTRLGVMLDGVCRETINPAQPVTFMDKNITDGRKALLDLVA